MIDTSYNPAPTPVEGALKNSAVLPAVAPAADSKITAQRVAWGIRNRLAMIRGLGPERLNSALDSFRIGYLREALILWDAMMRRDSTIRTVTCKRFGAVAELPWEIIAIDNSAEAKAHQQKLQEFYDHIEVKDVMDQDQTGGVELLIEQMASAVGMKYAVHEVIMRPGVRGNPTTAQLNFCPPWWFESRSGKLRYLPADFVLYGDEMVRGEWLVTVSSDVLMEATSLLYMYKWLSVADWANFVERFGLPFVLGKTPANVGSDAWDSVVELVANYRGDGGGVVNIDAQVDVQAPPSTGGGQPHHDMISYIDEKITQLWRGGDLGTQSRGGGAVGSNLQQEETDILVSKDARMINSAIRSQIDRMVIEYHFGRGVLPKAQFTLIATDESDVEQDIKIDELFLKLRLKLSKSDTYKRYGRVEPTSEQDTIEIEAIEVPAKGPQPASDPQQPEAAEEMMEAANAIATLVDAGETMDQVSKALGEFFKPLRQELQQISELPDGAMGSALARFQGEIGHFLITKGISPQVVSVISKALGDELMAGLQGKTPQT